MEVNSIQHQIGVIGSGECDKKLWKLAYRTGELIAGKGAILVNGGLGGVMEASARGARDRGGLVVGIIPYREVEMANPYCNVVIATEMGHARNMVIVNSSSAIISIGGEYGTISEMAIALKTGKPLVSICPPVKLKGMILAESPEIAVELAMKSCKG